MNTDQSSLDGQSVELIPVRELRFDPSNPRLPHMVDGSSESAVLAWMLRDGTIIELMGSIGSQGYFPGEPLIVVPEVTGGDSNQRYTVVEGNRRLAAVILLLDPGKAPLRRATVQQVVNEARFHPDRLPCMLFNHRDEVLDYLGFRHVTGIKQWDPLAKARHVRHLLQKLGPIPPQEAYREVAKRIGSRSDYVARLSTGLEVYEHVVDNAFYGLRGLDEDSIDFSVLTTALGYANIATFIGARSDESDGGAPHLRDDNLRDLVDWMFRELPSGRTVLGESRQLRTLAEVVSSPRAVSELKAGSPLDVAALQTKEPARLFQEMLRDARDRLQRAQDQIHRVHEVSEQDLGLLSEIAAMSRDLVSIVRGRLESDEPPR